MDTETLTAERTAEIFETIFRKGGVKFKEVEAFGSFAIITCLSEAAAKRVAKVLSRAMFNVGKPVESVDYVKGYSYLDTNQPRTYPVWRVHANVF